MTTYYIYEVPGHKNGATNDWDKRSNENFETYGIQPILIETMEGPNEPEFWQIVGDREWELADQNGYPRGTHYRVAREKRPVWNTVPTKEAQIAGGRAHKGKKKSQKWRDKKPWLKGLEASGIKRECPHCNKSIDGRNYKRWHGDNCKHKKSL